MFSMTTTASSTISPTASARPPSVMMLSDWPSMYAAKNVPSTEIGSETATISVERSECRNSRMMSTARIAP